MGLLLPLGLFLALFLPRLRRAPGRWQVAFVDSALVWGCWVVFSTEGLSLLHALTFVGSATAWSAAIALALVQARRRGGAGPPPPAIPPLCVTEKLAWAVTGAVLAVTGLTALVAPPNTWDSMTYHLARVAHWAQNHSLELYPSHILRQLTLAPFAEYAVLHLRLLDGDDQHANLVQWFAMAGTAVVSALLAGRLGVGRPGQALTALVAVTLPMGILQASSTQTDLVTAFWIGCAAWACLEARGAEGEGAAASFLRVGIATGLCALTKTTGYLFAFPFVAWAVLSQLRRAPRRGLLGAGIVLLAIAALTGPFHLQQLRAFGSPLGAPLGASNSALTAGIVASNVLRNVAQELGTPFTAVNLGLEAAVRRVHGWIGVSPDDPRSSFYGLPFSVHRMSTHEDLAGNPLHVLLGALAAVGVAGLGSLRRSVVAGYALAWAGAGLLFCAAVKWQPWGTRLHLPLFVLLAPLIGAVLVRCAPRVTALVAVGLVVGALPELFFNKSRPLIGGANLFNTPRLAQALINKPGVLVSDLAVLEALDKTGCTEVGVEMGEDSWEYPLFLLPRELGAPALRLRQVNVTNPSAGFPPESAAPLCAVITLDLDRGPTLVAEGRPFAGAVRFPQIALYLQR